MILRKIDGVPSSGRLATRGGLHLQIFDRVGATQQKQGRAEDQRKTGNSELHGFTVQ